MKDGTVRRLTEGELQLWRDANRLHIGYQTGTNVTPLDYILTGRSDQLIALVETIGGIK